MEIRTMEIKKISKLIDKAAPQIVLPGVHTESDKRFMFISESGSFPLVPTSPIDDRC